MNPKRTDTDGRIVVPVPAGSHLIHIFLQRQWDAKLGIAISITTAVLLSYLTFLAWRQNELSTQPQTKFERSFPAATVQSPAFPLGNNEQS